MAQRRSPTAGAPLCSRARAVGLLPVPPTPRDSLLVPSPALVLTQLSEAGMPPCSEDVGVGQSFLPPGLLSC